MKCSLRTMSTKERTERFPLAVWSIVAGSGMSKDVRLLPLHLDERPFRKVVVVQLRLHHIVDRCHLL